MADPTINIPVETARRDDVTMKQQTDTANAFYQRKIAQLEGQLRRSEMARRYAEDSSRRAWELASASWVRRPSRQAPDGTSQTATADTVAP